MSWSERDSNGSLAPRVSSLVPGGRYTLALVMAGAIFVIISEILKDIFH